MEVPLPRVERVGVAEATGRVLADDLASPLAMPAFDNSAMDGFAVRSADTAHAPVDLHIVGEARAGAPFAGGIPHGGAARISTGAPMPEGSDAVVRVEDALCDGDRLRVTAAVAAGHDVRPRGDDIAIGQLAVARGARIGAGERAMLAAVGAREVDVYRRPRVSIVATGDELVAPGGRLAAGQIYDSNSVMVEQLARAAHADVVAVVRGVGDTGLATRAALDQALAGCDLLVITGGVSMGEHDHVKPALRELGVQEVFWQVALRPGHPTWFGVRDTPEGRTLVLGLPGNPVSAYVTFCLFAAPALRAMEGDAQPLLQLDAVYAGPTQSKRIGHVMALRVRLSPSHRGLTAMATGPNQRSHAISSLVGVDGLALVASDVDRINDGDRVRVQLI